MKKRSRGLWVVLFGVPALLLLPVALIGSAVHQQGTIEFRVHEKHDGLSVGGKVPAILVPIAMRCAPSDVRSEIRCELDGEAAWALEAAQAAIRELSGIPDGILVDVRTSTEVVTIRKKDGNLVIDIDTPDEKVAASVPLRSLAALADAI
jgi:hypothetical protein